MLNLGSTFDLLILFLACFIDDFFENLVVVLYSSVFTLVSLVMCLSFCRVKLKARKSVKNTRAIQTPK